MLLRTVVTIANMVAIGVALLVLELFPHYAAATFYILLGWMFGTLVLAYGPYANRPIGGRAAASAPGAPAGTGPSLPSGHDLGFCIYCANTLPSAVPICPACGHRVLPS